MKEHERHERKKAEKGELSPLFKNREPISEKSKSIFSQSAESPVQKLSKGDAVMQPLYYE